MEPEKPLETDCCGNGCTPCVYDIYEQQLKAWRCGQQAPTPASLQCRTDLLSQIRFKPFKLLHKHQLTQDVFRFTFQPVQSTTDLVDGFLNYKIGQHLVLRCSFGSVNNSSLKDNNEKQIVTRSYTPITISTKEKNCCFDIFVKLYKNGVASDYFSKSVVGDIFYWRGPYGEFQYKANSFSHILMVCMGTGLAPMIPIIQIIVENDLDETFVHLKYGVRNINHVILRDELRKSTQYWNFTVEYYFSEQEVQNSNVKCGENIRNKRIDKLCMSEYTAGKEVKQLLVMMCGTDSFISDMKSYVSELGVNIFTNLHVF